MIEEHWKIIPDFPNYSISDLGNVLNNSTRRDMRLTMTRQGDIKVGLVKGGTQFTRSVKVLVAEAFVSGRSDLFDTPIQLNGHQNDNQAHNLAWRPRWFAWKYTRQFSEPSDIHEAGPIYDVDTRERYTDVYEAAIINGLLCKDIWNSLNLGRPCFPTNQVFAFVR